MKKLLATIFSVLGIVAVYNGATSGRLWLGPLVVLIIAVIRFFLEEEGVILWQKALMVAALGVIIESILIAAGIYTPVEEARIIMPWPLLPEWILILWLNFGLVIDDFRMITRGKLLISSAMSFIFAILIFLKSSYFNLLVIEFHVFSLLIIGFFWILGIALMLKFAQRIEARAI